MNFQGQFAKKIFFQSQNSISTSTYCPESPYKYLLKVFKVNFTNSRQYKVYRISIKPLIDPQHQRKIPQIHQLLNLQMNNSNYSFDFQALSEAERGSNQIPVHFQTHKDLFPTSYFDIIQFTQQTFNDILYSNQDKQRKNFNEQAECGHNIQRQLDGQKYELLIQSHQTISQFKYKKKNFSYKLQYNINFNQNQKSKINKESIDQTNSNQNLQSPLIPNSQNPHQQKQKNQPRHQKNLIQKLNSLNPISNLSKYLQKRSKLSQTTNIFTSILQYLEQEYEQCCVQDKPERCQTDKLEDKAELKFEKQQPLKYQSKNPFQKKKQPSKFINYQTYSHLLNNFRTFSLQFFIQFHILTQFVSLPNLTFEQIIYDPKNDRFTVSLDQITSYTQNNSTQTYYFISLDLNLNQLNLISTEVYRKFTEISIRNNENKTIFQDIGQILDHALSFIKNQVTKNTVKILENYFKKKLQFFFYEKNKIIENQNVEINKKTLGSQINKFKQCCARYKYENKLEDFKRSVREELCYKIICYNFVRINWEFKRLLLKYCKFPQAKPQNYACLSQCNNTVEESQLFEQKVSKKYMSQFLNSLKDINLSSNWQNDKCNKKEDVKSCVNNQIKKNSVKEESESFSDLSQDREQWQQMNELYQKNQQDMEQINRSKSDCGRRQVQDYMSETSFADLQDDRKSNFSILSSTTSKNINKNTQTKTNKVQGKSLTEYYSTIKQFSQNKPNQQFKQSDDLSFHNSIDKSRKSCPTKYFNIHQCNSQHKTLKLFQMCLNQPYVLKGIFLETLDEPAFSKQFKKIIDEQDFNIFQLLKKLCFDEQKIKQIELTRKFLIHLMQFQIQFISQMSNSQNSALVSVWNCVRFVVLNLFSHLATQIKLKVLKQLDQIYEGQNLHKLIFEYMQNHDKRWKQTEAKIRLALELSYQKILNYKQEMMDPLVTQKRSNVKKLNNMQEKQPELFELIKNLNQGKIPTDKYDFELTSSIYNSILKIMKKEIFSSTVIERFYKKIKKDFEITDLYGESLFGKKKNIQKAREQFQIFLVEITKVWNLITFLPFYSFEIQKQNVKRIKQKRRLKLNTFTIEEILENMDTIYIHQGKRLTNQLMRKNPQNLPSLAFYFVNLFRSGRNFFATSLEQKVSIIMNEKYNKDQGLHRARLCIFGEEQERKYFMESVQKVYMGKKDEFFLGQKVLAKFQSV